MSEGISFGFALLKVSWSDLLRAVGLLDEPEVESWLLEIGDEIAQEVDPTARTSSTEELLARFAEGSVVQAGVFNFLPEDLGLPPLARLPLYLVALIDVARRISLTDEFVIATDAAVYLIRARDALVEIKQRYHREQSAISALLHLRSDQDHGDVADSLVEALGLDLEGDLTRMADLVRWRLRQRGAGGLVREVQDREPQARLVVESEFIIRGDDYWKEQQLDALRAFAESLDGLHRILPARIADRWISDHRKTHQHGKTLRTAPEETLVHLQHKRQSAPGHLRPDEVEERLRERMAELPEDERRAFRKLVLTGAALTLNAWAKAVKLDPSTLRKRRRQARPT